MKNRILALVLCSFSAFVASAQIAPPKYKQFESATNEGQILISNSALKAVFQAPPFPKWTDTVSTLATQHDLTIVNGDIPISGLFNAGTVTFTQKDGGTFDVSMGGYWIPLSQKAAPNGVATLGADGKVPTAQLPSLNGDNTFVVASEAAMLALSAVVGDIAKRTDISTAFILQALPAATLSNWIELPGGDGIEMINGKTGTSVTVTTDDVSEGSVNKYFSNLLARQALSAAPGSPITYNNTNGQIGLSVSGVTAAAGYNTFTVDAYGRVTAATTTAYLTSADLNAYYTKTNLQTSGQAIVHWGNLNGIPNNIALNLDAQENTGSTSNTITLNHTPALGENTPLYMNGVRLHGADYSVSGTTLTLGFSRTATDVILIENWYQ